MSQSTISTYQLFHLIPDQETARLYLESRMWPEGVRCPYCGSDRVTTRKGGYYRCNACDLGENFTVRTNTVMERSKIPLHKWVYAMYLLGIIYMTTYLLDSAHAIVLALYLTTQR